MFYETPFQGNIFRSQQSLYVTMFLPNIVYLLQEKR